MKAMAKQIWERMSKEQQAKASVYYCNLAYQVHHNCEHGGKDFAKPRPICTVKERV